jgi:cell division septation protein DedD
MERVRDSDGGVREFRVEGLSLYILGAAFLVALAGAFFLGRWVERRSAPDGAEALATATTGESEGDSGEIAGDDGVEVTYFDTVAGGEKAAEPGRQAVPDRPDERSAAAAGAEKTSGRSEGSSEPAKTAASIPDPPPVTGPFFVQVFAGRDRDSATRLVEALERRGYRGRLDTQRDAEGPLYKVRVGGYATDREAREAAEELRQVGYDGSWVTRVD